MNEESLNCRSN